MKLSEKIQGLEKENETLNRTVHLLTKCLWEKFKTEPTKTCEKCDYFIRHYVETGRGYVRVAFGHCVKREGIPVKPKDSCEVFEIRAK